MVVPEVSDVGSVDVVRVIVPLRRYCKRLLILEVQMNITSSIATFVFGIPLVLAMMGLMLALLVPAAGSAVFGLAWHATSTILSNFVHYWYLTVPITGFVIWADVASD